VEDTTPIPWYGIDDGDPTDDEVLDALDELHDTAPGIDGLRAKELQEGDELRKRVVDLVRCCWAHGEVPRDFKQALLVTLPKKGNAVTWDDHRGITLLSVAGKVLARLLLRRARGAPLSAWQHGFRRANSCNEAALTLKLAMQEARRIGLPAAFTFVDLTKAYDSVPRELLWETAELRGFGPRAMRIMKALYEDEVFVKLGKERTKEPFSTAIGVRQGCLLSPVVVQLGVRSRAPNSSPAPLWPRVPRGRRWRRVVL
jgi:hypothetical protein